MPTLPQVILLENHAGLPEVILPGARIHVSDGWRRDERVIDRLRLVHADLVKRFGPDRGLIDPTGLLGVDTSTTQTGEIRSARQVTQSPPIGRMLARQTPKRAKRQPTRTYRD